MLYKTPRLLRLTADYVAISGKRTRYERRRAYAAGENTRQSYARLAFDCDRLAEFMALWTRQRVFGRRPQWHRYTPEKFEREHWSVFGCALGLHPVLICDSYAYAGPPLYDKVRHPWLAKFLWFKLIDWLIDEDRVQWLDFGGGSQKTWQGLLETPDESYKWQYIPKSQRDPAHARPWRVQLCRCGWRQLVTEAEPCRGCS